MTCTTCGRDNPAHLTFCQECGQRLGPRIAPPTPPIGLGAQDSVAGVPAQLDARAIPSRNATLGMTQADPNPYGASVDPFGAPPAAHPAPAPAPPAPAPARPGTAATGGERRCRVCDTLNAPNLRYCTSCGSTLEPIVVNAPAPPGMPSPSARPAAPTPAPPAVEPARAPSAASGLGAGSTGTALPGAPPAIAPMRVVDLAPGRASDAPRVCSRCRGTADAGAQFCKFCGAPLAEPKSNGSPRPSDADIAPPPPRAPATAAMPATEERRSPYGPPPVPATAAAPPSPAIAPAAPPRPPPPVPSAAPSSPSTAPRSSSPSIPPPAPPTAKPSVRPSEQRGKLVVIAKSGADGPSYPFADLLDIGRVEGNIVVGEDPYLSPRHVRIVWQAGKLLLRDLGSTNGVYIRLSPTRDMFSPRRVVDGGEIAIPLVDRDFVLVGQQVLRFEALAESDAGLGPAQEHGTLLFGSPAAPRYARLGQRTVEGITRDVYYVRKAETVLGRESGDVVFTEDPFLSRRHAAIRVLSRDGKPLGAAPPSRAPGELPRFALVDLGSSNGTFIRIRGDIELVPGDHFRVGQQLFRVDFGAGRE